MVVPPTVAELFAVSKKEGDKMDQINMEASDMIKDKGSQFTAYAAEVSNLTEIRMAYRSEITSPGGRPCCRGLYHPLS